MNKLYKYEVLSSAAGQSIYINDHRIIGPKPAYPNRVQKTHLPDRKEILTALDLTPNAVAQRMLSKIIHSMGGVDAFCEKMSNLPEKTLSELCESL